MAKPPKTEFVGPYDFSPSYAVPDDFSQYRLAGMEEKYQLAGMRMLELGFQDEAEMFYQKAHDLNPKAFAPALNLGIIAGKKGKYVEAFKFLNAAKLIDPLSASFSACFSALLFFLRRLPHGETSSGSCPSGS